jgi:hypothetical protein
MSSDETSRPTMTEGRPELLELPQRAGALARCRPIADDAELGEDTPQPSPAGDARHLERTPKSLRASADQQLARKKVRAAAAVTRRKRPESSHGRPSNSRERPQGTRLERDQRPSHQLSPKMSPTPGTRHPWRARTIRQIRAIRRIGFSCKKFTSFR